MQKIIHIVNGVTRHPLYRMAEPVNLTLCAGENIAIVGDNGAGKSLLVDIITERHPLIGTGVAFDFSPSKARMVSDNVKYVAFRDSYGTADATYYHQQRWNQHDTDDAPLVCTLLDESFAAAERGLRLDASLTAEERDAMMAERTALRHRLYALFHLTELLDKRVIMLSSGELRKLQLTRTLLANPRVLILDNPFVGLDAATRQQLRTLLQMLTTEFTLQVILVLPRTDEVPDFITHVVSVEHRRVGEKVPLAVWRTRPLDLPSCVLTAEKRDAILSLPYTTPPMTETQVVVDFRNVTIRYGDRTILHNLNLTIKNGERWALSGENGSGKSTLLSLICADNPQAYANDIVLFGRQRGSGESIWDIKQHIGYISPEMHRAYMKNLPAIDIVASGLRDSVGLYFRPRPEQFGICEFWMDMFGVGQHRDTPFLQLSSGEQRLVLLARAFVKDPALLILDEPMHGLDLRNRQLVADIIEAFCRRNGKTLIMVTHYEDELPAVIDHRVVLKREKGLRDN